jgi:Flp pilus assembly protein TadD
LGFGLERALRDGPALLRRFGPLGLAVLLAVFSLGRSQVWRSEESLWRDTAEKSPGKVRPKLQLARALAGRVDSTPERLALLRQARQIEPDSVDIALELGVFHLQTGSPGEALVEFDRALATDPGNAQIQANRGAALYLLDRLQEADAAFRSALEIDPCNFDARHNLVLLYGSLGDSEAMSRAAEIPDGCRWSASQKSTMLAARQGGH